MPHTQRWLTSDVKGFILDISGVLYNSSGSEGGEPVEGSIEAVQLLRQNRIPFRCCSNESTASREHLCKKLGRIGFDIRPEEVICPAPVAFSLLRERNLRPYLLVQDEVLSEFDGINTTNPNCVVMGDAQDKFTYENLNRAFSVLINSAKPLLISMGCGRYYKETDGMKIDVGAYAKGLEYAAGIKAEYLGKPNPSFFSSAVEQLKLKPSECVMVGDDVLNDVGGSKEAGLKGILVRTGKCRKEDEKRPDVEPDGVVDNLLDGVRQYLDFKNR